MKRHEIKTMALSELEPASYNPRAISAGALAGLTASVTRFGLVQPVIWNKRTKRVVGGHQRIKALLSAGETQADVVVVDLPETEEKALNIALNNPFIEGEFTDGLHDLLVELKEALASDFAMLGFNDLLEQISKDIAHAGVSEGSVPAKPKTPKTKPGDLYTMGKHLLLCGDSTNPDHVKRVLSAPAAMMFTDPPWNVAIGKDSNPRHRQREGLKNDDLGKDFFGFLTAWAKACLPAIKGDLYCVMGSREWPAIDKVLRDAGMHWSAVIVWVKDSFVLGRRNYHPRFEPIWYGWSEKGTSSYVGKRDQDDVWEVPRPKVSEEHPTMKPVALVARAIQNSSVAGDRVFEPFGGSGSTLMACEQLGRVCSTIEIDPGFCDVIVERWEKHTGQKAKRV